MKGILIDQNLQQFLCFHKLFQMNFPGKSIDDLVLEEPEENGADENGEEESEEEKEENESDDSEEVEGEYFIVQEHKSFSDIERSQF